MVIEVVVGFGPGGSDSLLVDESVRFTWLPPTRRVLHAHRDSAARRAWVNLQLKSTWNRTLLSPQTREEQLQGEGAT
jgi:hypothetical protein